MPNPSPEHFIFRKIVLRGRIWHLFLECKTMLKILKIVDWLNQVHFEELAAPFTYSKFPLFFWLKNSPKYVYFLPQEQWIYAYFYDFWGPEQSLFCKINTVLLIKIKISVYLLLPKCWRPDCILEIMHPKLATEGATSLTIYMYF